MATPIERLPEQPQPDHKTIERHLTLVPKPISTDKSTLEERKEAELMDRIFDDMKADSWIRVSRSSFLDYKDGKRTEMLYCVPHQGWVMMEPPVENYGKYLLKSGPEERYALRLFGIEPR